MKIDDKKIGKILLDKNYLTKEDLKNSKQLSEKRNVGLIEYLLTEELITKDLLGQAIAEIYEMDYADLNSHPPSKERVHQIPEKIARKHRIVIFKQDDKEVILATDSPIKAGTYFKEVEDLFDQEEVKLAYSLKEDIEDAFVFYRKELGVRIENIVKKGVKVAPQIIEEIIEDALILKASDIHIEPQKENVIIRFRLDGVLQEVADIEKDVYENLTNKIKVEANMRIDDHFSAQDGAIRFEKKDKALDMRVSIVPTLNGEKISIRIFAEYIKGFSISDLGLTEENQKLIKKSAKKPFGMILVTGPTGSGKTTTLYSLLKLLNSKEVNLTTIEDPVEYKIPGINQIQVDRNTNLTFSKGLRSIVRQDPDIILVGEIRDEETAEIAVNAALTGHLLLSTFHANDAATSIPRLLDMGVEPFLLASTMEIIVAQRLVREVCESCRMSYKVEKKKLLEEFEQADHFFSEKMITLYKGKGCQNCNNKGYKGRTAIFELIRITSEMKNLILSNPSSDEIWQLAKKQGSQSLFEDGILKVKKGTTTIKELLRVAPVSKINDEKTKK